MTQDSEGEFSVWQFLMGNVTEKVASNVGPEKAVEVAQSYMTRSAAKIGIIQMVRIVDKMDQLCFEWRYGRGITFK